MAYRHGVRIVGAIALLVFLVLGGCMSASPHLAKSNPCASFGPAMATIVRWRAEGRVTRALRATSELDARCDVAGDARRMKATLLADLGPPDPDPMALVRAADALLAAGHLAEGQLRYERAIAGFIAAGQRPSLVPRSSRSSPSAIARSRDARWRAILFEGQVWIYEQKTLRFAIEVAGAVRVSFDDDHQRARVDGPTISTFVDLATGAVSHDKAHEASWSLSKAATMADVLKPVHRTSYDVGRFEDATIVVDHVDGVFAIHRLAAGDAIALTATVAGQKSSKEKREIGPSSTVVDVVTTTIQLAAVHVTAPGGVGASIPLLKLACEAVTLPKGDLRSAPPMCDRVHGSAVSEDGATLVVGLDVNRVASVRVFDLRTGVQRIDGSPDDAFAHFIISPDGSALVAQTQERKKTMTRLYGVGANALTMRWSRNDIQPLRAVAFLADEPPWLLTKSAVVSVDGAGPVQSIASGPLFPLAIASSIAAKNGVLVACLTDGHAVALEPGSAKDIMIAGSRVRFARDGRSFAIGSIGESLVRVFASTGEQRAQFSAPAPVYDIDLSSDGTILVAATGASTLMSYAIPSTKVRGEFTSAWKAGRVAVAYSRDGSLVATSDGEATIVFDTHTHAEKRTIPRNGGRALAFTDDGALVGLGEYLWSVVPSSGAERFAIETPPATVTMEVDDGVAFVSAERGFELRSLRDGAVVEQVELFGVAQHGAFTDKRLFVATHDANESEVVVYGRTRPLAPVGIIRFAPSSAILVEARGLVEVLGDDAGFACAIGTVRLPVGACDGIRVSPGANDLLSTLL